MTKREKRLVITRLDRLLLKSILTNKKCDARSANFQHLKEREFFGGGEVVDESIFQAEVDKVSFWSFLINIESFDVEEI